MLGNSRFPKVLTSAPHLGLEQGPAHSRLSANRERQVEKQTGGARPHLESLAQGRLSDTARTLGVFAPGEHLLRRPHER